MPRLICKAFLRRKLLNVKIATLYNYCANTKLILICQLYHFTFHSSKLPSYQGKLRTLPHAVQSVFEYSFFEVPQNNPLLEQPTTVTDCSSMENCKAATWDHHVYTVLTANSLFLTFSGGCLSHSPSRWTKYITGGILSIFGNKNMTAVIVLCPIGWIYIQR